MPGFDSGGVALGVEFFSSPPALPPVMDGLRGRIARLGLRGDKSLLAVAAPVAVGAELAVAP